MPLQAKIYMSKNHSGRTPEVKVGTLEHYQNVRVKLITAFNYAYVQLENIGPRNSGPCQTEIP